MLGLLLATPGVATASRAVAAVAGFTVKCAPCMIALAIGTAWVAGDIHGHHKEGATWSARWAAAEAKAERDRMARDAFAKARMEKDANDRLAGISASAAELETKVRDYEQQEELRRATGGGGAAVDPCLTDQSDDRWLRDIRRRQAQPAARRGLAERLRAPGGRSPGPGQH